VILTKVGGGDLNAMSSTGKQHESAKPGSATDAEL